MSEYTREMIGNCRRWIKDLTDDSVNETLCADEFAGLLDDALDEIERQQARIAELEDAQRWIPVSERLPEVDQEVLVFDQRGDITIDYLVALNREGVAYYTNSDDGAVYWMPLPKLPEVQE